MCKQAANKQRIAVVWGSHFQDSLKSETRNNRGAGVCTKVFSNGKINNWIIFHPSSNNKSELFPFLSTQLLNVAPHNRTVVNTGNKMVVSNHDIYLNDMCFLVQKS